MPVQINGKLRLRLTVPADVDEASLKALALADPKVRELRGEGAAQGDCGGEEAVNIVV